VNPSLQRWMKIEQAQTRKFHQRGMEWVCDLIRDTLAACGGKINAISFCRGDATTIVRVRARGEVFDQSAIWYEPMTDASKALGLTKKQRKRIEKTADVLMNELAGVLWGVFDSEHEYAVYDDIVFTQRSDED
jgi:hypothetical protein